MRRVFNFSFYNSVLQSVFAPADPAVLRNEIILFEQDISPPIRSPFLSVLRLILSNSLIFIAIPVRVRFLEPANAIPAPRRPPLWDETRPTVRRADWGTHASQMKDAKRGGRIRPAGAAP